MRERRGEGREERETEKINMEEGIVGGNWKKRTDEQPRGMRDGG